MTAQTNMSGSINKTAKSHRHQTSHQLRHQSFLRYLTVAVISSCAISAHPVFRDSIQMDYWQHPCPAEEAAIAYSAAAGGSGGDGALELAKALELTASVISSAHELKNDATAVMSDMLGGDMSAAEQVAVNMQGLLGDINARLARTNQATLTSVLKEYRNLLATFAREMSNIYNAERSLRSALSSQFQRLNFGASGLQTLLCAMSMLEMHLQPTGSTRTARSLVSTLRSEGFGVGGNTMSDAALASLGSNMDKVIVLKGLTDTLNSMIKHIENSVANPKL